MDVSVPEMKLRCRALFREMAKTNRNTYVVLNREMFDVMNTFLRSVLSE